MSEESHPIAIVAAHAPRRTQPSSYPQPFASRVAGREKRPLGDLFGLSSFGVNLTRLEPGAITALRHSHSAQDEFIYVLCGEPTLVTNAGETPMKPGMCAGFPAGGRDAHHLINTTDGDVVILEVGDRSPNDTAHYPDDDIRGVLDEDGRWTFQHKDGTPY